MKQDIHPSYNVVTVNCACGSSFDTRSTLQGVIQVDVCSACHPFFTGKQKFMDTAGRIDRLKKKFGNKIAVAPTPVKRTVSAAKPEAQASSSKLSIKDKLKAAAQQKPAEAPKAAE